MEIHGVLWPMGSPSLRFLHTRSDMPWCVAGDFNDIFNNNIYIYIYIGLEKFDTIRKHDTNPIRFLQVCV